ncbi:MAG TPA: hypothetical protein VNV42_07800 [Solirubrobacteraceae bacterium]|jgi:hypothetical protein|nr:hypothetical protein [Solirubrobacteraceae bacterium]
MSTHNVSYLTALIEQRGIELPGCREEIEGLTPWAVVARYDGTFEKVLDRAAARMLVSELQDWSRGLVIERQMLLPQAEAGQVDDEKTSAAPD